MSQGLRKIKLSRVKRGLALFLAAATLAGCAGIAKIPEQTLTTKLISPIAEKYAVTDPSNSKSYRYSFEQCGSNNNCRQEARDKIAGELFLCLNFYYHQYRGNLQAGHANANFTFESLNLMAGTLGTALPAATAKTVFASLSTVITGTQTAVNKNYYAEKTIDSIVTRMDADRAGVEARIKRGMDLPYPNYGLEMLLSDMNDYYRAGTAASALQSMVSQAAADLKAAEILVKDANTALGR